MEAALKLFEMKKILFLIPFLSLGVACSGNLNTGEEGGPAGPGTGSGETDGYKLVWEDQFNDGALDESKWYIEVNGDGGGNQELQYYRAENISVGPDEDGNGCLIITARRENFNGKSFTSGRLNTSDRYEFTHGKVEASIKLPSTANGLWPAFWLLGADYDTNGWPRCGEIDIMEMGNSGGISSGTQDRYFNGAAHWGFYRDGAYPNYANSKTNSYSLQDGEFHLFTLIWDDNSLSMYLDMDKYPDSAPYYKMDINDTSDDWSTGHYFHHDFFIIFNLAVGAEKLKPYEIQIVSCAGLDIGCSHLLLQGCSRHRACNSRHG